MKPDRGKQLNTIESTSLVPDLEKAMAPHSSPLAWKIPWTDEPGMLQSMGLQRVGHDWSDLAAAAAAAPDWISFHGHKFKDEGPGLDITGFM